MSYVKDKDLVPIYVNGTTGNDNNNGLTAATAVKTIGKALGGGVNSGKIIYVAGGIYDENVLLEKGNYIEFILQENTTLNGSFSLDKGASCYVHGNNNFTLNGACTVTHESHLYVDVPFIVNGQVLCSYSSTFIQYSPITVNSIGNLVHNSILESALNSNIMLFNDVTLTGNARHHALSATHNSSLITRLGGNININANTDFDCISSSFNGYIVIFGSYSLTINGTYTRAIAFAGSLSSIILDKNVPTILGSPTGNRFYVLHNSIIDTGGLGGNRFPGTFQGTVDTSTGGVYL